MFRVLVEVPLSFVVRVVGGEVCSIDEEELVKISR